MPETKRLEDEGELFVFVPKRRVTDNVVIKTREKAQEILNKPAFAADRYELFRLVLVSCTEESEVVTVTKKVII